MTVLMEKGETIALVAESGAPLTTISMGLGWDIAPNKGGLLGLLMAKEVDLDASCLLYNSAKEMVDVVWFHQLSSLDGSVRHSGDNQSGEGEGDDERIVVDLPKVPAAITSLVFVVTCFSGQCLDKVVNGYCRLLDNNRELARFTMERNPDKKMNAMIVAKLQRHGSGWQMQTLGACAKGKTFLDFLPTIQTLL